MRVYYAMTAALDEQLGRLLQALQTSGLDDNTIVVFTSDHGEQFGANARVFKMTFFDKSARVPLLIRWPGKIPKGRRSNACFSAVDLMPTLCGMLGVGYPDAVDGIDMSDSTRVDCSCEPDFAFLQGMGHTFLWQDGFEWRAIRDQRFTYARYRVNDEELLFDNVADPEQSTNLASDPLYRRDLEKRRQWLAEKMLAMHDDFQPWHVVSRPLDCRPRNSARRQRSVCPRVCRPGDPGPLTGGASRRRTPRHRTSRHRTSRQRTSPRLSDQAARRNAAGEAVAAGAGRDAVVVPAGATGLRNIRYSLGA